MAAGSVNLDTVVPPEYELEIPTSSSASILRKSQLRLYPTRQATYAPFSNNWLEFNVSSPTEILLLRESYFTFDITRTDKDVNGAASTQYDNSASLDFAGIHSIIKNLQVRSGGTNTMLNESQYYNLFSNAMLKMRGNPDQTDHMWVNEGRSVHGERGWEKYQRSSFYLDKVQPTSSSTSYWYNSTSADASYSYIVPALQYAQLNPNLTSTTKPVTWAIGTTYAAGVTVLYDSSTSPITFKQYPNTLPAGSSTAMPLQLDNNPTNFAVTLPSIWVSLQGSNVGNTPATGSLYWREQPIVSPYGSHRKNVQTGDILNIEVYVGGTTSTFNVQSSRVSVIAVDQLTGIIVCSGKIPSYISDSPCCYIKSVFVSDRPFPLNSVPGRMEIVRYNNFRYRVTWHPLCAFFDLDWPLFVSKNGLNFRIELEFGDRCMSTGLSPYDSPNALDYQIDDPRFVGFFSAPEASVMRDIITKWNSADGLIYYCPSYVFREIGGVTGEKDVFLNYSPGVRSARGVVIMIQSDQISSANTALARAMPSLSTFLRSGVRSWQANVGAHLFPIEKTDLRENNQVPDYTANEGHHLLFKWLQSRHFAIRKDEYRPWNPMYNSANNNTVFIDANAFLIYIDLSRSNTANSALTGTDVSITPLQIHLERGEVLWGQSNGLNPQYTTSNYGGVPGIPLYRVFVLHDAFIRNSSSVLTTLQ